MLPIVIFKNIFVFSFQKINYGVSWCEFFFSLTYVVFTQLVGFVSLCLSLNLKCFQPLFLHIFFRPTLFLFYNFNDKNIRSFVIVPEIPDTVYFQSTSSTKRMVMAQESYRLYNLLIVFFVILKTWEIYYVKFKQYREVKKRAQ